MCKRSILKVFLFVFLFVGFSCCILLGGSSSEAPEAPKTKEKPYEGVTIRWITQSCPPAFAKEKLFPEFEAQTGIKVEMEALDYEHLVTKEMMDFVGETGVYDIMAAPYAQMGKYVENGYILPIDKFMNDPNLRDPNLNEDDIIESLWKQTSWWKGEVYGFPSNSCIMFVWYRKDLFEDPNEKEAFKKLYGYELVYPTDWNQYRDIAEFFTRPDEDLYGLAISGKRHYAVSCEFLNYMRSFGGDVVDANGRPVINSKENIDALEYFVSLFEFAPPGSIDFTWDEKTTAFQQGKVVMALAWNDQAADVEDPSKSKVAGKMGYGPIPVGKSPTSEMGPWSYVIPKHSKNPEAAYLFMQWLITKDVEVKLAPIGYVPCRESSYAHPDVKEITYFYPATLEA